MKETKVKCISRVLDTVVGEKDLDFAFGLSAGGGGCGIRASDIAGVTGTLVDVTRAVSLQQEVK